MENAIIEDIETMKETLSLLGIETESNGASTGSEWIETQGELIVSNSRIK